MKNLEEMENINSDKQINQEPPYAQMHNGDSYINPETGKSFAEEMYPNAEEDVACLGTD